MKWNETDWRDSQFNQLSSESSVYRTSAEESLLRKGKGALRLKEFGPSSRLKGRRADLMDIKQRFPELAQVLELSATLKITVNADILFRELALIERQLEGFKEKIHDHLRGCTKSKPQYSEIIGEFRKNSPIRP